jgi:NAD(P)-dependent dehydrogenase (short-subunit alcohol dehydrogenase family)
MRRPPLLPIAAGLAAAVLASTAGVVVARAVARRRRTFSFEGKVVAIAGGSRGLGLVIARQLAEQGAHIALIARHGDKLEAAAADLADRGANAHVEPCDIGDQRQAESAVANIIKRFGRIDVLINDAGIIETGPFDTMTYGDFHESMLVHFWGPLYLTMAALPHMKREGGGRIVNISSIGGKLSVPHLLPYCASKFALTGLSEGLRAELLKDNIFVTTVCPGMMRTGSHINAYFKGHHRAEYAWFSIGNGLPFISTSAQSAAAQVIRATSRGDAELIITLPAQLASKFNGLFPGVTADMMGLVNRVLPGPNGNGAAKIPGRESKSWLTPSILTLLSDKASKPNNEA